MANHPNRGLPEPARSIKAWRAHAGLTQVQAAERYGLPLTTLVEAERRATTPRTHIARMMGEAIADLLAEIERLRSRPPEAADVEVPAP